MTNFRLTILMLIVMIGLGRTVSAEMAADQQGGFTSCSDVAATTAIPQNECQALIALRDATSMSTWGWATSNNPCDWFGISCTSGQITALNFSLNGITGTLPSQLGNLASLQMLEIRRNSLTGAIPASLSNLSNLQYLNLERNQLDGAIPSSLDSMPNLLSIQLNENQLTGSIPASLGSISTLQGLRLYGNQLTGSIPPELGSLTDLTSLRLHDNNLNGTLPPALGSLESLTFLQVSNNPSLEGAIPNEFSSMATLTDFYLFGTDICVNSGSVADGWLGTVDTVVPEDVAQCTVTTAVTVSGVAISKQAELPWLLMSLVSLLLFTIVFTCLRQDSHIFRISD